MATSRWQRRGGVRMIVAGLMMWGDVVVVHEVDCHVDWFRFSAGWMLLDLD